MRYRLICDTKQGARVLCRDFNSTEVRAVPVAEKIAANELPYNFRGLQGGYLCALTLGGSVIHRFTIG